MCRLKHALSRNIDVVKVWAAQSQGHAYTRTVSFNGKSLYSYSAEIAGIIDPTTCLVSSYKYSTTTAHHIWTAIALAEKNAYKIFEVPNLEPNHTKLNYYYNRLKRLADLFWDAHRDKARYMHAYQSKAEEMRNYAEYFGLKLDPYAGLELSGKKAKEQVREMELRKWNNVYIPKWLFYKKKLVPKDLFRIRNAQVRAEFVKKVGLEKILDELATVVETFGNYQLLLLKTRSNRTFEINRKRPYLKMLNPSSDEWHIEGVHSNCKTISEALQYRRYGRDFVFPRSDAPKLDYWNPSILT